jgi:hypothetical protein
VGHGRLLAGGPDRVGLRLVCDPMLHVTEEFTLTRQGVATRRGCIGELSTYFEVAGQWWTSKLAGAWKAAGSGLGRKHPG